MCGICGIVSDDPPPDLALLRRMMGRLGHRGPDGNGLLPGPASGAGPHPPGHYRHRGRRPADEQCRRHPVGDVQR